MVITYLHIVYEAQQVLDIKKTKKKAGAAPFIQKVTDAGINLSSG